VGMLRNLLTAFLSVAFVVGSAVMLWQHPVAHAQQRSERLILKDGSFQSVAKYEIQGDRVHYMSAERYEWEDIPASLIDWDATNKYNADLGTGKLRTHLSETPEEREEREKEEANSPEIAPGLKLPGSGGVFLLDQFQGKPELAEIVQNGSELNKSEKKKSVLRSAINPLGSNKHAFEIKGEHAQIQSHQPRPIIYIDIDEGPRDDTAPGERFAGGRRGEGQHRRQSHRAEHFCSRRCHQAGDRRLVKGGSQTRPSSRRVRRGRDARPAGDESLCVGLRRQSQRAG
jgi:hypothetical protein